jgi:hypothetical protein
LLSLSFALFLIINACEKTSNITPPGKDVEIYVLESCETVGETSEIVSSSAIIGNEPLIRYDQILYYNSKTFIFKVDDSAISSLNQDGGLKFHFKAFAITVDKKIIYTGYFWPGYSSSIVKWFVIDPLGISNENELQVEMAYPTNNFAGNYADLRNDKRIIDVLKRDGKLRN